MKIFSLLRTQESIGRFSGFAALFLLSGCATFTSNSPTTEKRPTRAPASYIVQSYPMLEALQKNGYKLSKHTLKWMEKWKGIDLEDESLYEFKELSGSTSINMKIRKLDPTDKEDGYKSRGSFAPKNSSGNPNTELAAFHLTAILGFDHVARPFVRYELGPRATNEFKSLINAAKITNKHKLGNKEKILEKIADGETLLGALKAGNPDSSRTYDEIISGNAPKGSHPIIQFLQAENPQPTNGKTILLANGYSGDELELAREYSILMTLDSILQQWDRYSGGNVEIQEDAAGKAHFYFSDNGGAEIGSGTSWVTRNLNRFSRFDREAVKRLREIHDFLGDPAKGFLGYTNAEDFVVDLGLYSEFKPSTYADRLKRNIGMFLDHVKETENERGEAAYLP